MEIGSAVLKLSKLTLFCAVRMPQAAWKISLPRALIRTTQCTLWLACPSCNTNPTTSASMLTLRKHASSEQASRETTAKHSMKVPQKLSEIWQMQKWPICLEACFQTNFAAFTPSIIVALIKSSKQELTIGKNKLHLSEGKSWPLLCYTNFLKLFFAIILLVLTAQNLLPL